MRTLDLIKSLSDAEIKAVEKLLSGEKREVLFRCFKELKKYRSKDEEPTHEELFEKILKEPYDKDKDYLLRNRMRQLNEVLYEFLVTSTFRDHIAESPIHFNYWLAKSYYDRNRHDLFNEDIDEFIKEAEEKITRNDINLPAYSLPLYSLKNLWNLNHGQRLKKAVEEQIDFTDKWIQEETKRVLYRIREIELRKAFLTALMAKVSSLYLDAVVNTDKVEILDLRKAEKNDWYAQYLSLSRRTHETEGEERIRILKEMLQFYEDPMQMEILGSSSMIAHMTNLSMESISIVKYSDADEYLKQTLLKCKKSNLPIPIVTIQGYILNQVYQGYYNKGLEIYRLYNEEIKASSFADVCALIVSFLHLLLGNDDEAIRSLPPAGRLMGHHQVHFRYVYVISFMLRNDYTLAQNELFNLKRTIKSMSEVDIEDQMAVAKLFDSYIKASLETKGTKEKKLQELKSSIEGDLPKTLALAYGELPLRWLLIRLKIIKA